MPHRGRGHSAGARGEPLLERPSIAVTLLTPPEPQKLPMKKLEALLVHVTQDGAIARGEV